MRAGGVSLPSTMMEAFRARAHSPLHRLGSNLEHHSLIQAPAAVWTAKALREETHMNSRRRFLSALGASTLAIPLGALAQQVQGQLPRLGILLFNSPQIDPIEPLILG